MRYTGIQPQYFPRLHYFARILNTDVFMLRDDVQFVDEHKYPNGKTDKSYQAHTPIKQPQGRRLLPVAIRHQGLLKISQTQIAYEQKWPEKHFKYLTVGYQKAANFPKLYPQIKQLLQIHFASLAELNIASLIWGLLQLLEEPDLASHKINLPFINKLLRKSRVRLKEIRRATASIFIKKAGDELSANEKIVGLIKEVSASEDYCGGTAHAAYMDENLFKKQRIKVTVQNWKCKEYPQQFSEKQGFIPNLSIIDLLMNVPRDHARKILLK